MVPQRALYATIPRRPILMLTPRWIEEAASKEPRHLHMSKAATVKADDAARTPRPAEEKSKSASLKWCRDPVCLLRASNDKWVGVSPLARLSFRAKNVSLGPARPTSVLHLAPRNGRIQRSLRYHISRRLADSISASELALRTASQKNGTPWVAHVISCVIAQTFW